MLPVRGCQNLHSPPHSGRVGEVGWVGDVEIFQSGVEIFCVMWIEIQNTFLSFSGNFGVKNIVFGQFSKKFDIFADRKGSKLKITEGF